LCTLYSKRIYLTRCQDLCRYIAATKTVDCSFIKAENSTQVSSKNNSRKNTCIAKQFAVPSCFTKFPFAICWTVPSSCTSTVCSAVYYLVKTLFLKAVKQLRCFFFCFRALFYRINTHALKNAFQLQNNSKSIWFHLIGWDFVLKFNYSNTRPKIQKLIYLNLYFFLKLSKCLIPSLKCLISVA
jgi:hypothetical protein